MQDESIILLESPVRVALRYEVQTEIHLEEEHQESIDETSFIKEPVPLMLLGYEIP